MTTPETPGHAYEAVVHAGQRLRVIHLLLGLVGAVTVWTGAPPIGFNVLGRGGGWIMAAFSILGWVPYLISWGYSRTALDGHLRAVNIFSAAAVVVTVIGAGLYQNVFSFQDRLPTIVISTGVTVSLLAIAKLCSLIWSSR